MFETYRPEEGDPDGLAYLSFFSDNFCSLPSGRMYFIVAGLQRSALADWR